MTMRRTVIAIIAMLAAASASAEGYTATAKLSDGTTLLVLEHSKDCGGKKSATLLDNKGMDTDHTCDVTTTDTSISARFGARTVSAPADHFSVLSLPSVKIEE